MLASLACGRADARQCGCAPAARVRACCARQCDGQPAIFRNKSNGLTQLIRTRAKRANALARSARTSPRSGHAHPREARGYTLIEMIIAMSLLAVLVTMVAPVVRSNFQRQRELELKNDLRNMRRAIDDYHNQCRQGVFVADNDLNKICYPPDLETLVAGVKKNDINRTSIRFLRRIPRDPFTGETEWGLRSTEDEPNSTSWGGDNVWDVYSKAEGMSLDGKSHYNEW
jgi:general secretion pathway protein G